MLIWEEVHRKTDATASDYGNRHPIHHAIDGISEGNDPSTAIEMVQFLLDCDHIVALQEFLGRFPLVWICSSATPTSNTTSKVNARLEVLRLLYDAHPETIENNEISSNLVTLSQDTQTFINKQLAYPRQLRDHRHRPPTW